MITITLTLTELAYLRAAVERDMEDARDVVMFGDDPHAAAALAAARDILRKLPTEAEAIPF
jgi:hypothetical protein